MVNTDKTIGENAGKLWHFLNENQKTPVRTIMLKTKMRNEQLYPAIGWLARENKIRMEDEYYSLGESNLVSEIGTNAGKVWQVLNENKVLHINGLKKSVNLSINDVYSAIGWLAKESKVEAVRGMKYKFKE